ncbi:MAG: alpha/beta fold hydrolase [Treponema sp.]|jgi:pimeloyl-ACP methyl ester carboxylesterase|nr:alpha/beta fold hydrolase [Treponema sp.]
MKKNVYLFLALVLLFAGCETSTSSSDDYGEPPYSFTVEEIHVSADGMDIFGLAYIPEGAGRVPTLIYSPGFSATHESGEGYGKALAREGIAVYCLDFRGGSNNSQSEGATTEMTMFTEQADVEAAMAGLKSWDFVDSDNLFLMGASQGGMVSAITAAANANDIRGLILEFPAFNISLAVHNDLGSFAPNSYATLDQVPDTVNLWGMELGRVYYEVLDGYDVYEHIGDYKRDVLIMHGDADFLVPISYSERALEVYQSAELKVIPGAGHGFAPPTDSALAIGYILDYIGKQKR